MAFDDDEATPASNIAVMEDDDAAAEDGLPDYQLFASMLNKKNVSSKSIRKGEKDFESHGTRSQEDTLEASRQALENVLAYTRTHRPDSWVRGWYFPDWWSDKSSDDGRDPFLRHRVVVVEHERGGWMKDIGRTATGTNRDEPGIGRLWLLPEEALYLVERGTLDLWWPDLPLSELLPNDKQAAVEARERFVIDNFDVGLPLTLEAAYALLVGYDDEPGRTSLPKFQVYSHLKRAGFRILRAPSAQALPATTTDVCARPTPPSLWQWLVSLFGRNADARPKLRTVGPLVTPGLYRTYTDIYRQLELVPRHRPNAAMQEQQQQQQQHGTPPQEPFRVHFHVWKSGGLPFSKKKPPPPDFRIAVTDTAGSGLPTLSQLDALFGSVPPDRPGENMQGPGRLYQRIRHGYRNVIVAVVDWGLVNFMRFGEAAFGEEKLFERFDGRGQNSRGGRRGGRGGGRGRGRGRGGGGGKAGRGGERGGWKCYQWH
ncbi:hypothetical protein L249_7129 [Ophiocordyceps polyrhachis-furcata BCC 54312]|uniref:tRNA-splicing endonuclease subunit Sen54 N-terminal domain-containing protein n=1 Tax=Ophiocordyceps polyrhachis-furcata BCC 54312 TaxID=1330021 RepID=A0A367LAE4_9HYPO|nr:hypothetical protein L249_7129 [Ophiocordyceps polyrhachis-furcata BCC 54312]